MHMLQTHYIYKDHMTQSVVLSTLIFAIIMHLFLFKARFVS